MDIYRIKLLTIEDTRKILDDDKVRTYKELVEAYDILIGAFEVYKQEAEYNYERSKRKGNFKQKVCV